MSENLTVKAGRFVSVLPHCRLLNMSVDHAEGQSVIMRLPYSEAIIGNPENGVIAGGSITTLMDTACGTAAFIGLPGNELCPTLDLRVDYFKSAQPGKDLVAKADIIRITNSVVFTRADVYQEHGDEKDVVATCAGNFMRIGMQINGRPV